CAHGGGDAAGRVRGRRRGRASGRDRAAAGGAAAGARLEVVARRQVRGDRGGARSEARGGGDALRARATRAAGRDGREGSQAMTLRDPEVLDLLADDPTLLAVADAVAATQQAPRRPLFRQSAPRVAVVAVVAAAAIIVALLLPQGRHGI